MHACRRGHNTVFFLNARRIMHSLLLSRWRGVAELNILWPLLHLRNKRYVMRQLREPLYARNYRTHVEITGVLSGQLLLEKDA